MRPMLFKYGREMRLALRIVSQRRMMSSFSETKEQWAVVNNDDMQKLSMVERSHFNGTHMDTLPQPTGNFAIINAEAQGKYNTNLFFSSIAFIISIYVWIWADLTASPNIYAPINLEEAWEEIAERRSEPLD